MKNDKVIRIVEDKKKEYNGIFDAMSHVLYDVKHDITFLIALIKIAIASEDNIILNDIIDKYGLDVNEIDKIIGELNIEEDD